VHPAASPRPRCRARCLDQNTAPRDTPTLHSHRLGSEIGRLAAHRRRIGPCAPHPSANGCAHPSSGIAGDQSKSASAKEQSIASLGSLAGGSPVVARRGARRNARIVIGRSYCAC
jgi:hypothetical protein